MKPESHVPVLEYAAEHPLLQNPGETRVLEHLPQLDGVRAVAVGLVLWFHFMPEAARVPNGPPWGAMGVGLFFTLSGFLITRILLKCRLQMIAGTTGFWRLMKQFYVRRILRIFPLYYAVLAILLVINPTKFRHRAWWDFLYLTNVRFSYWPPQRPLEIERHLWSLSVEEQFYLIWPLLILITPRKLLAPLIICTIALAPYWRYTQYRMRLHIHEWMMPGCLDLLGIGALLAIFSLPQFGLSKWRDGFVQLCGLIGLPLFFAYVAQHLNITPTVPRGFTATNFDWLELAGGATYPITALAAAWLIGTAAKGFRGPIGWFLTAPPVVYIGRISYGLYVIHLFVPHVLAWMMPGTFGKHANTWWHLAVFVAVSVGLASLSWYGFEAPINRLKRYFEYDKRAEAKAATKELVSA